MPRRDYGSVRLPRELMEKVRRAIDELGLGYSDPTSFVVDAVREHLRRLGYLR